MISNHTRAAITALLAVDDTATDAERTAVAAAVSGQWAALTITEAAKRLGCKRPKLYKMLRMGLLHATPDGRISELELARFMAETKSIGEVA